jgi:2-polyprenyl-6-methoxyphenol hydroxylase-like FAD-dependent oxidoreductase
MAIEDGLVLARCLKDGRDKVAALAEYERLRKPRTTKAVKVARFVGRIASSRNPIVVGARPHLVRVAFGGPAWRANCSFVASGPGGSAGVASS